MATNTHYTTEDIQVLTGIEAVRKRPGMYFASTGDAGMHHMIWEVAGNAVDEHLRGHASYLRIQIDGDTVIIDDDGRGIPVTPFPREPGLSVLEVVLTRLHGGSGFRRDHVHLAKGMHGIGLAAVNAVSARLDADVWCDGRHHRQSYARGVALGPIRDLGPANRTGTRIAFTPDFTIFTHAAWDRAAIATRLRELAALAPQLTTILDDEAFRAPDGLADLAAYTARPLGPLHTPLRFAGTHAGVVVDAAIVWTEAEAMHLHGFVSMSPSEHGTHVDGLTDALVKAFGRIRRRDALRAHLQRGLVAYLNVMFDDPRFGSPTRDWLINPEVRDAVEHVVRPQLRAALEAEPALHDAIVERMPS